MARRLALTALVVVVLGQMSSALAEEKPVRMTGTLDESLTPDPACGGFSNTITGTMKGTPFGPSKWSSEECVDFTAEPGAATIRDAHFVLRTRRGTISGTYEGRGGLPSMSRHVYVTGTFTVRSGTGAYRGVRGRGLLGAVAQVGGDTVDLDLSGTVRR